MYERQREKGGGGAPHINVLWQEKLRETAVCFLFGTERCETLANQGESHTSYAMPPTKQANEAIVSLRGCR